MFFLLKEAISFNVCIVARVLLLTILSDVARKRKRQNGRGKGHEIKLCIIFLCFFLKNLNYRNSNRRRNDETRFIVYQAFNLNKSHVNKTAHTIVYKKNVKENALKILKIN